MKTATTLAMTAVLNIVLGTIADAGESAISESRAALNENWGRMPAQPEAAQAVRQSTGFSHDQALLELLSTTTPRRVPTTLP